MDNFAFMIDQMFADPNLTAEADYVSVSGWSRSVRVIFRQPDQISDFMQTKAVIGSHAADISASQIETAQENDRLNIGGQSYLVKQTQKDSLGLIWNLHLRKEE